MEHQKLSCNDMYKWKSNFKFCKMTYNMTPYVRKIHSGFFTITFHAELYLYDQFRTNSS